jgi:hypothetical protein
MREKVVQKLSKSDCQNIISLIIVTLKDQNCIGQYNAIVTPSKSGVCVGKEQI